MEYPFVTHGSENSLDHDIYVIIPSPVDGKSAKNICRSYNGYNANLLVIENSQVSWCYKGTIDECNNSLLSTYELHEQNIDNPINAPLERQYGLKMIRTVRGILSYFSRTEQRKEIKKALKSEDFCFKIDTLKSLSISNTTDYQKNTLTEVYKFFAFQLGQTIALLLDQKELFTKNSVSEYFSDLKPFLDRDELVDTTILDKYLKTFISIIETSYTSMYKQPTLIFTNFFGKKEVIKTKLEIVLPPVVVFDLDMTLYDESPRAKYRINNDLDTYFSLCDQDKPIQAIVDILLDYHQRGYEIWIVSGRYEPLALEKTINALKRDNIPYHGIKLRGKGNYVPDYVLKPAWMAKYIGLERIEKVYDDQDRVIEGFRKKGLSVVDVKLIY